MTAAGVLAAPFHERTDARKEAAATPPGRDVNLLKRRVDVHRSLMEVPKDVRLPAGFEQIRPGLVVGPTKAGRRRVLDLPASIVRSLEDHMAAYPPGDERFVFTGAGGGPVRHHNSAPVQACRPPGRPAGGPAFPRPAPQLRGDAHRRRPPHGGRDGVPRALDDPRDVRSLRAPVRLGARPSGTTSTGSSGPLPKRRSVPKDGSPRDGHVPSACPPATWTAPVGR